MCSPILTIPTKINILLIIKTSRAVFQNLVYLQKYINVIQIIIVSQIRRNYTLHLKTNT